MPQVGLLIWTRPEVMESTQLGGSDISNEVDSFIQKNEYKSIDLEFKCLQRETEGRGGSQLIFGPGVCLTHSS